MVEVERAGEEGKDKIADAMNARFVYSQISLAIKQEMIHLEHKWKGKEIGKVDVNMVSNLEALLRAYSNL